MEAPKNIYLFENPIDGTPDYRWLSKRNCSDDVEYVRTDAFFKKLEEWLDEYISDMVAVDTRILVGSFKNYMEGKLDYGRKTENLSRCSKKKGNWYIKRDD